MGSVLLLVLRYPIYIYIEGGEHQRAVLGKTMKKQQQCTLAVAASPLTQLKSLKQESRFSLDVSCGCSVLEAARAPAPTRAAPDARPRSSESATVHRSVTFHVHSMLNPQHVHEP